MSNHAYNHPHDDHGTHSHGVPNHVGPFTLDDMEATVCAANAAINANLCHGLGGREPDLWGWDFTTSEVIVHDRDLYAPRLMVSTGEVGEQTYVVAHFPEPTGGAWTVCAPIAHDRTMSAERIMKARFAGRVPADRVDLSRYIFPDAEAAA